MKFSYGTLHTDSERPEIKVIRNLAKDYLENDNDDAVFTTNHALERSSQRKIPIETAIETISTQYFVEYQQNNIKQDKTLFYDGHPTKIIAVNSVADLHLTKITLITVEHRDDTKWNIKGPYIERKKRKQ